LRDSPVKNGQHSNADERTLLVFEVGRVRCAVAIDRVHEINRNTQLTPVYTARDEVLGVVNLRGQVVTVLDLPVKLGFDRRPDATAGKNLIVQTQAELVGLIVDDVETIIASAGSHVLSPPPSRGDTFEAYLEGVLELEDGLVLVLNVDRLVEQE
jgi:purine-binding chemotaxis protein CheW